jgi:hypothetical protein
MDITLATFKNLLHTLKEKNISLKVRTHTGWSKDYLHIVGFISSMNDQNNKTFGGVVLSNDSETEGILINNITTITAFELGKGCEPFAGQVVYVVSDNLSLKIIPVE